MVSIEGSLSGESVDNESEVHGYNNEVFEVLFDSYSLGSNFSSSIDHLAIEGSSDFLAFLSLLLKKVSENIVAPVLVPAVEKGTSMKVAPWPKKCPMLKDKCSPPPITLLKYN